MTSQNGFLAAREYVDVEELVSRLKARVTQRAEPDIGKADIPDALAGQAELNQLIVGTLGTLAEWLGRLDGDLAELKQSARAETPAAPGRELNQLRSGLRLSLAMVEALMAEHKGEGNDPR